MIDIKKKISELAEQYYKFYRNPDPQAKKVSENHIALIESEIENTFTELDKIGRKWQEITESWIMEADRRVIERDSKIAELKSQNGWHKVSDGTPDSSIVVHAWNSLASRGKLCRYSSIGEYFIAENEASIFEDVTHWKPFVPPVD